MRHRQNNSSAGTEFHRHLQCGYFEVMISQAQALHADLPNCHFLLNEKTELSIFDDDSFDLVYSVAVLQYQPSRRVARQLISEFVRVLKPNGLIIFQIPTHLPCRRRLQSRRRLYALLKLLGVDPAVLVGRFGLAPVKSTAVSESSIREAIISTKARILLVDR